MFTLCSFLQLLGFFFFLQHLMMLAAYLFQNLIQLGFVYRFQKIIFNTVFQGRSCVFKFLIAADQDKMRKQLCFVNAANQFKTVNHRHLNI